PLHSTPPESLQPTPRQRIRSNHGTHRTLSSLRLRGPPPPQVSRQDRGPRRYSGQASRPGEQARAPQERGVASQGGPCYPRSKGVTGRGNSQHFARISRPHEPRALGQPECARPEAPLAARASTLPRGRSPVARLHHRGPARAPEDADATSLATQ